MSRAEPPPEPAAAPTRVYARIAADIRSRFARDTRLYRNLPRSGRVFFDRALPFVLVHRPPEEPDAGTCELVQGTASYLVAPSGGRSDGIEALLRDWARTAVSQLGSFLVVELWASRDPSAPALDESDEDDDLRSVHGPVRREPTLSIRAPEGTPDDLLVDLASALRDVRICPGRGGNLGVADRFSEVLVCPEEHPAPPGLPPLDLAQDHVCHIGLEVSPFFRSPDGLREFPRVVLTLRARLATAVENAVFRWSQEHTSLDAPHPRALARTRVGRAARFVDERLAEIYGAFDLLMQVTPVNTDEAWRAFAGRGYEGDPELAYRPLPFDPEHLKRRLFDVPIEKVKDPLLADLFREKQEELDRQITLLRDVDTDDFVHSSRLLYGPVDDALRALAEEILIRIPPPSRRTAPGGNGRVGPEAFVERARQEIARYHESNPEFWADVEIRDDITSGLMVSKGTLCVSSSLSLAEVRVEPLIQHEVGTHLVTFCNGRSQPFRLLASGLAGYDPLQEGLAVLAEYLVGGLTMGRMRTLAGRVLAVRDMLDGIGFGETWRRLVHDHGFRHRAAFNIAVRVYRGGGLVKDAMYLSGLRDLLGYLAVRSNSIEPLLVGKVALRHVDAIQELVLREVLGTPMLKPRWMDHPGAAERLEACREMDVLDIVEEICA